MIDAQLTTEIFGFQRPVGLIAPKMAELPIHLPQGICKVDFVPYVSLSLATTIDTKKTLNTIF